MITLHHRATQEIIAIPTGMGHRWAEIALDLAGFTPHQDGVRSLPLADQAEAHAALTRLYTIGGTWQITIATSRHPYLGDVADQIARMLGDHWETETEHDPGRRLDVSFAGRLWSTGPYTPGNIQLRVPSAAILRDGVGVELLLLRSDGRYLVAALEPSSDVVRAMVPGPRAVAGVDPFKVAAAVRSRLLPEYQVALHHSRLREMEEALSWAQGAHRPDQDESPPWLYELNVALHRFLEHAPHLIAAIRQPEAPDLTAEQQAFLRQMEAVVTNALDAPETRPEALQPAQAEAMSHWLTQGMDLVRLAEAATPTAAHRAGSSPTTPARPAAGPEDGPKPHR